MISTPGPTLSRFRFALVVPAVILVTATACGSNPVTSPPPSVTPVASPPPSVTRTPDSNTTTPEGPSVQKLAGKVSDARAMKHLQAMQKIADQHGGNRAAGTSGYDASVEYVVDVLRDSGFKISTPTFESSGANGEGAGESQRSVIAQTQTGDPGQVVMIGAHLDSVEDGPGIVDNDSGVASLLEIATQLGAKPAVHNTVRFAFFGDEESGAVGSTAYVERLSDSDRKKIKLYLNVDMVASPNAGYLVQGGKGSDQDQAGPPGSATIARVLAPGAGVSSARRLRDDQVARTIYGIHTHRSC